MTETYQMLFGGSLRFLSLLLTLILLAGCAAPDTPRGASDARAPALTSASSVDLHNFTLNITMPAGEPTALVVLNVTKDMWVRPFYGAPTPTGYQQFPRTSDAFWMLCPWAKSLGLTKDIKYVTFPFWVNESYLQPATTTMLGRGSSDSDGGHCLGATSWNSRDVAIAADAPEDGKLLLILTAEPEGGSLAPSDSGGVFPEFHMTIGIARQLCADATMSYCPPKMQRQALPSVRAGIPTFSTYHTAATPDHLVQRAACTDCGFKIQDDRLIVGDQFSKGTVTFTRTGVIDHGLTFAGMGEAFPHSPAPDQIDMQLTVDGQTMRKSCRDATSDSGFNILAPHRSSPSFRAAFDVASDGNFEVRMLEIPIDLGSAGYTLPPTVVAAFGGVAYGFTGEGNMCN